MVPAVEGLERAWCVCGVQQCRRVRGRHPRVAPLELRRGRRRDRVAWEENALDVVEDVEEKGSVDGGREGKAERHCRVLWR